MCKVITNKKEKENEQTLESYADMSVSTTKTCVWSGLQISLHGSKQVRNDGSDLRETIIMDSVTTINLFGNPSMITNIQKLEIPMNFLTHAGSKIVN